MRLRRLLTMVAVTTVAACGGSATPTTTTAATTTTVAVTTTTVPGGRVTLFPNSTPFIREGDRGAYVEALQFYLVCTGHGEPIPGEAGVSVDGAYGPITADAVAYYQAELRRVPSGDPDEETFASLARDCAQDRTLQFATNEFTTEIAGNAAPGDDEVFVFAGAGGQVLGLDVIEGLVAISVTDSTGSEVETIETGTAVEVELDTAQAFAVRVTSTSTTSYRIAAQIRSPNVVASDFGPMVLTADGLGIADLGDDPVNTVAVVALLLGQPDEDTGWLDAEAGCTGSNRHVTWLIQGAPGGSTNQPAVLETHFTDTGGTPYFSQYAYRSYDLTTLDPIAQGLTTADGISIGSTLSQFNEAVGDPDFTNAALGLTEVEGILYGFEIVGDIDAPDATASRAWYVGAGADGCPDFG